LTAKAPQRLVAIAIDSQPNRADPERCQPEVLL
jgi:hypothetical protein